MPPSKVELYAAIRRDARAGMSARGLEKKYRFERRTVVSALSSAWPEPRKRPRQPGHRAEGQPPALLRPKPEGLPSLRCPSTPPPPYSG